MHGYLTSIKLHGRRNPWRELVAKSWWLGCRMRCAPQQLQTFNALLSSWPLPKTFARAVLSRDAPVAKRSPPHGGSTLTPVLPGSTFRKLSLSS